MIERALARPLSVKLLSLVVLPLVLVLALRATAPGGLLARAHQPDLEHRAAELERVVQTRLAEVRKLLEQVLHSPASTGRLPPRGRFGVWSERLEGLSVTDAAGRDLVWQGSPAEAPAGYLTGQGPAWIVRRDGLRTRLLIRAGPDEAGRHAVASLIIDSRLDDLRFERLIPAAVLRDVDLETQFVESSFDPAGDEPAPAAAPPGAEPGRAMLLRAPDGLVVARVMLWAIPLRNVAERAQRRAFAWGACAAVVLLWLLFSWRERARTFPGLLVCLGATVLARGLLLAARAPLLLLPRELGSASLYGSSGAGGLLVSPADLVLTATMLYLAARATVRFLHGASGRHPVALRLASAALAALALAASFGISASLAHDSRDALLQRSGFLDDGSHGALTLGWILVLLAAAELCGQAAGLLRRRPRPTSDPLPRIPVAVSLVLLVLGCGIFLQSLHQRLERERIVSEILPQVLEQSARRALALNGAVADVTRSFDDPEAVVGWLASRPTYMAFEAWSESELFFRGYKSAIDFYTAGGELVSHFGFDLPELQESPKAGAAAAGALTREESYDPAPGLQQRLLHAEAPVRRDGELLGYVIGHVVDEPENLPFLPSSQPYLGALGAGAPQRGAGALADGPHYVLYDGQGRVVVSSLRQPPAETGEMRRAARSGAAIRVGSGAESYAGVAAVDGEALHLLLARVRGPLERLAAATRLALQALALLGLIALVPLVARRGGWRALVQGLRRSFYRKLLAALLVASVVPLVGLALFLQQYIERRGAESLQDSAIQFVSSAQRQLEDYAAAAPGAAINDNILYWLRSVVGQEIHVYEEAELAASSKRELFASGLLSPRLPGEVQQQLVDGGLPYVVLPAALGPIAVPVAYAPLRLDDPARQLVVAVPLVLQQREIERAVERALEMILLATVLLVLLLAAAAAGLARTVARPVHELVGVTNRIARGDYETRLVPHTEDELSELVHGFNAMASALARQRADLERRREYIERLLLHATTGVLSTDAEGQIVTLNPAARQLLSAVDGLAAGQALHERLAASASLRQLASALADPRNPWTDPLEVDLERDGEPRRYRLMRIDLPEPSGTRAGTLVLMDDVTDLMRSNQLAAWAEMARAIAHEIKNPLTPIQLSTEHLRRLLDDRGLLPSPEIEACLETVIKQVRTLYTIAGEFSAYAKLPVLEPIATDPAQFLRETIAPYRVAPPPGVTIVERYAATGQVAIDRRVLSRALINLVENALQAMPHGGRLTLSADDRPAAAEVALAVTDTGTGIDPQVRRRLFDLYFSTKSSGTGLGLAIARRSVEAHHGRIEVESEVGRGTTFRLVLPRSA